MENLARLLDLSWLVSRGTSAHSENSHSATDRDNTRYGFGKINSDMLIIVLIAEICKGS